MIHLRIPGPAKGKERARVGKGGGYTPKQTKDAEAQIKAIARHAGVKPIDGPVQVTIRAVYEPPKSWTKKRRSEAMGSWKISAPDRDNIEKLVTDALNRIAYHDDAQIVTGTTQKFYGHENALYVRVEPAPDRVPMGVWQ